MLQRPSERQRETKIANKDPGQRVDRELDKELDKEKEKEQDKHEFSQGQGCHLTMRTMVTTMHYLQNYWQI